MAPNDKAPEDCSDEQNPTEKKAAEATKQRIEDDRQDARQDARQEMRAVVRREARDAARQERDEADTAEIPRESLRGPSPARHPERAAAPPAILIKGFAERVGWLKILVVTGVALVAFGASATLYAGRFATTESVLGQMSEHVNGPGHPITMKVLTDVNDEVIRIKTIQETMLTTLIRIENKLDAAIQAMVVRGEPGPAGPPGATGAAGRNGDDGVAGTRGATGPSYVVPQ